jgi:hypothetical protein
MKRFTRSETRFPAHFFFENAGNKLCSKYLVSKNRKKEKKPTKNRM